MLLVNISCCCFSCEGALLASGSADCTVKLWDVASSTKTLKTEDVYVWYVKFLIHSSIHLILLLWLQNTLVFFFWNSKGSSVNRLRLLKALPTKSTPVYSLRVRNFSFIQHHCFYGGTMWWKLKNLRISGYCSFLGGTFYLPLVLSLAKLVVSWDSLSGQLELFRFWHWVVKLASQRLRCGSYCRANIFISNPNEPGMYCRFLTCKHRRSFAACCNLVTLLLGNYVV